MVHDRGKDHTGERYGHWLLLRKDENKTGNWICKCDCGGVYSVNFNNMKQGRTTNCVKCQAAKARVRVSTHGMSKTKLYNVWRAIRDRCVNPKNKVYYRYGGRGITVCKEWFEHFETFMEWALSHNYKEGLQIDRIDVNGNYEPSNCRWVTQKENARNRESCKTINYKGKSYKLPAFAEIVGIKHRLLYERIRKGWSVEEAISIKPIIGNNQTTRGKAI